MKIFTIKHAEGLVGVNYKHRPYVIGFVSKIHAYMVRDMLPLSDTSKMYLHRGHIDNIAPEISTGLGHFGIHNWNVSAVTIDTDAVLTIIKKEPKEKTHVLQVNDMEYDEFLRMPFDNRVGIVMPQTMDRETDVQYEFLSHVVDPCDSIEMFKFSNDSKRLGNN